MFGDTSHQWQRELLPQSPHAGGGVPGNPRVLALEPDFIGPKARTEKQDCELNATKRWVERHAALAAKKVILLGDSTTLLTFNLLAFLAHTFLELVDIPYRAIRQKLSARKTFFHDFTTLTKYLFFESWSQLMAFMIEQLEIEPADTG
jgi:hypothetical protein